MHGDMISIPSEISGIYLASRYFCEITEQQVLSKSDKSNFCQLLLAPKMIFVSKPWDYYIRKKNRGEIMPAGDSSHDKL
jgi:hypothetical protein